MISKWHNEKKLYIYFLELLSFENVAIKNCNKDICQLASILVSWYKSRSMRFVVCATSKGSDQPAHTRSLIRAFAYRLNILWLLSYWVHNIWSLKGVCTGSSESTLVKMSHLWKSHAVAHKMMSQLIWIYSVLLFFKKQKKIIPGSARQWLIILLKKRELATLR